jgi:hypothetical protein
MFEAVSAALLQKGREGGTYKCGTRGHALAKGAGQNLFRLFGTPFCYTFGPFAGPAIHINFIRLRTELQRKMKRFKSCKSGNHRRTRRSLAEMTPYFKLSNNILVLLFVLERAPPSNDFSSSASACFRKAAAAAAAAAADPI